MVVDVVIVVDIGKNYVENSEALNATNQVQHRDRLESRGRLAVTCVDCPMRFVQLSCRSEVYPELECDRFLGENASGANEKTVAGTGLSNHCSKCAMSTGSWKVHTALSCWLAVFFAPLFETEC